MRNGDRLIWDQRGSGDPRFVAGFTDLGAFEHQRHPYLVVDTLEDKRLCERARRSGVADCPLRGAIEIANTRPEPDVITFDPPGVRRIAHPAPDPTAAGGERCLSLWMLRETGGVTITMGGHFDRSSRRPRNLARAR